MTYQSFHQINVKPDHCPFCGRDLIPYATTQSDLPVYYCGACKTYCHVIALEVRDK